MGSRSVHFALSDEDTKRVLGVAGNDDALVELIQEDIEGTWDLEWLAEGDKAWDAIHRCLTDGTLHYESINPLHMCILGGKQLHLGDDYIVSLVLPDQVRQVSEAVDEIDESTMRKRYFAIPSDDYGQPLSEEDFGYTWEYFLGIRDLYRKAAKAGRSVLFTVDQ